jgi:chromosomal replication initiation ATPase DnaA
MRPLSLWPWMMPPPPRLMLAEIAALVANRHGMTVADLKRRTRLPAVVAARKEAMVWMQENARSRAEIGRFFGLNPSTVLHHLERDDP